MVVIKNKELGIKNHKLKDKLTTTNIPTINANNPLVIKPKAYNSNNNNDFYELYNNIQNIRSLTPLPRKYNVIYNYLPLPYLTSISTLKYNASKLASIIKGVNKKYSNILFFYSNKNKWDTWCLYLDMKFHNLAILFPTKQYKIEYIWDYYKNQIFSIIKG